MVGPESQETGARRPIPLEQEVFLRIQKVASDLLGEAERMLKSVRLTPSQYNALRILRGAGGDGLACNEVSARMITRDPDITRLLDRLEGRMLVSRSRETSDRRVIRTRITERGLRLLRELDRPIVELHIAQLRHLGEGRLRTLSGLLALTLERDRSESGGEASPARSPEPPGSIDEGGNHDSF